MGCWINARMEDRVFKHNLGYITIWVVLWYVYLKPEQKGVKVDHIRTTRSPKDPLLIGTLPYEEDPKPDQG